MSIYVLFGYIVSDIGYIVTVIGAVKNFNGYIITITDAEKNFNPCFVTLHAVALLVSFTIKEQNKIKKFKYKVAKLAPTAVLYIGELIYCRFYT